MEIFGISLVVALVIVVALLLLWFVKGEKPETLGDLAAQLERVEAVATIAVAGAEQMAKTRRIPDSARFSEVEKFLIGIFPDLKREQIRLVIESAVYWLNKANEEEVIEEELRITTEEDAPAPSNP